MIEYALPVLTLIGLAVLLFAKPVIMTEFEETDEKMGTPTLVVKLNALGSVGDFLNSGNQSTPQLASTDTSRIKQRILRSNFFMSPFPRMSI